MPSGRESKDVHSFITARVNFLGVTRV
jgi:hypothetical protein